MRDGGGDVHMRGRVEGMRRVVEGMRRVVEGMRGGWWRRCTHEGRARSKRGNIWEGKCCMNMDKLTNEWSMNPSRSWGGLNDFIWTMLLGGW